MAHCRVHRHTTPATQRFNLPPEHAPALAQEGGPVFFGGVHEMLPALIGVLDQVTESFRQGRRRATVGL